MTPTEFRRLVEQMRAKQKEYFRSRRTEVLAEAKELERRVDQEIADAAKGPLLFGDDE